MEPSQLRCHELFGYFYENQSKLGDRKWLENFLKLHCHFKPAGLKGSHLKCLQIPSEFADYLVTVSEQATISRYLEVGVASGGSWFLTDSYFRAVNPKGYKGSVGYDIENNLVEFGAYKDKFSDVEFRQESSDLIELGKERYDLTLIDARHQDEWVTLDFERVRNNSNYVSFHDIVLPGRRTSVDKFWNRVKPQFKHWEFINKDLPVTCGIGLLST